MSEIKGRLDKLKPILTHQAKNIYDGPKLIEIGLVRLTKLCGSGDLDWLLQETVRISMDYDRIAVIGYAGSNHFALYVNDLTNGEFDKMGGE